MISAGTSGGSRNFQRRFPLWNSSCKLKTKKKGHYKLLNAIMVISKEKV